MVVLACSTFFAAAVPFYQGGRTKDATSLDSSGGGGGSSVALLKGFFADAAARCPCPLLLL
jgi:hypothetical protein